MLIDSSPTNPALQSETKPVYEQNQQNQAARFSVLCIRAVGLVAALGCLPHPPTPTAARARPSRRQPSTPNTTECSEQRRELTASTCIIAAWCRHCCRRSAACSIQRQSSCFNRPAALLSPAHPLLHSSAHLFPRSLTMPKGRPNSHPVNE